MNRPRSISNQTIATSIVLAVFVLFVWDYVTAQAHGGQGAALLVTKVSAVVVKPPSGLRIDSIWAVHIYQSPTVEPFLMTEISPTNRAITNLMVYPDSQQMFFRSARTDWPLTNYPVRFSWTPAPGAQLYRISHTTPDGSYLQIIETANKTQLTYTLARAFQTNIVTVASGNTNGVWSAESDPVIFKPEFVLSITK